MLRRTLLRLAALKPISLSLAWLLPRLDRPILRWTSGRYSLTSLITGLETVTLTTTGAKSGLPRNTTLFPFWDGECAILIASNFGQHNHPAWHYNLKATPRAVLSREGQARQYQARPAQGEERERYYQLAVESYPGYAAYRQRASHREIVVWVLTPTETQA
jgi:deazaflavin-dependent oxidoreductase (nitroreductase family)